MENLISSPDGNEMTITLPIFESTFRSPDRAHVFGNAVYYPNWIAYKNQPPSSLDLEHVSHIFYAFASIEEEGQIQLSDVWADAEMPVDGTLGCIRALTQLKTKFTRLKVILSVGGGSQGKMFSRIIRDKQAMERFAVSARALMQEYNLDGIDVDWEFPQSIEEGTAFFYLLQRARAHLPQARYILSAALPVGTWVLKYLNLFSLSETLDIINLMAYDFAGPWKQTTGHQAQLFTEAQADMRRSLYHGKFDAAAEQSGCAGVKYLLEHGVPAEKIFLGIPAYGRSFLGASDVNQPYNGGGGQDGVYEYRELPRPGTEEYTDLNLVAGHCEGGDGGFVTYDTVTSVQSKARFVKEHRLGGLFYWHIGCDAVGDRSLVRAGYEAMKSIKNP